MKLKKETFLLILVMNLFLKYKNLKNYLRLIVFIILLDANICFGLPETRFIDFEYHQYGTFDRIELLFNKTPRYYLFALEKPDRLILDIKNCFFSSLHKTASPPSSTIHRLRVSQFDHHKVRFVIEHNESINHKLSVVPQSGSSGTKIIIDIKRIKKTVISHPTELIVTPLIEPVVESTITTGSVPSDETIDIVQTENVPPETMADLNVDSVFNVQYDNSEHGFKDSDTILPVSNISETSTFSIAGSIKNETAYRTARPHQFTKIKNILTLNASGKFSSAVSYYTGSRIYYDPIYELTDNYNGNVENDQKADFDIREAYVDVGFGDFDLRMGNQQIVWGQAVGLFFADFVNPKDLREFILPEFDQVRIPVFAANLEYYSNDNYLQFIFIPFPKFNEYGKSGSEFDFSDSLAVNNADIMIHDAKEPSHNIKNTELGFRSSRLIHGWDLSGFYLYDLDNSPVPYRSTSLNPPGSENTVTITYRPSYERVHRLGMTFSKDYLDAILKGEFILSKNKSFAVSEMTDLDGVITKDSIDWLIGVDYTFFNKIDSNFQIMQGVVMNHDSKMVTPATKTSFSVWLKTGFVNNKIEPELFFVSSLDQTDFLFRPKLVYNFSGNFNISVGADIFGGQSDGDFGLFSQNDRVYMEMIYYY